MDTSFERAKFCFNLNNLNVSVANCKCVEKLIIQALNIILSKNNSSFFKKENFHVRKRLGSILPQQLAGGEIVILYLVRAVLTWRLQKIKSLNNFLLQQQINPWSLKCTGLTLSQGRTPMSFLQTCISIQCYQLCSFWAQKFTALKVAKKSILELDCFDFDTLHSWQHCNLPTISDKASNSVDSPT